MPIYLDCNATTPVEEEVAAVVLRYTLEEYGNAASRTHARGARAKQAVETARDEVGAVIGVGRDGIVFTSGATESNNIAILGLEDYGRRTGRRHIVTSAIEHKSVLEPIAELERRGFEINRLAPTPGGWIEPSDVSGAVRSDTLLVSIMHVNNETGVIQPIVEIARELRSSDAYFHVDAAQGFGKLIPDLQDNRIDLISLSSHKIYGPKGIGALAVRRRGYSRPPLQPLFFGGGQEKGLRPGTLPVPQIVGLGAASRLAMLRNADRNRANLFFKEGLSKVLGQIGAIYNGDPARTISNTINVTVPGLDSEAAMLALRDLVEISNGSACTSQSHQPSHVLLAMGLEATHILGALRFSWCHSTARPDWDLLVADLNALR